MFRRRHTFRRLIRSRIRRIVRTPFRQRWRSPDDLAEAMTCFRRAIRAHRRLNQLAPHEFDAAVVDRDRRQREERRAWMATWQPAIEKAYGPPTPEERERERREEFLAAQPPPLPPRTRQAVEREYAAWQFWMSAGRLAKARHLQRRPHAVPSLGRVVRLLEIAMDFGSLAIGSDWRHPEPPAPPAPPEPDFEADLRRAYGNRASPQPEPPPVPTRPDSVPSSSAAPQPPAPAGLFRVAPPVRPAQTSPGQPVSAATSRRRDAWSSWARHKRRQQA